MSRAVLRMAIACAMLAPAPMLAAPARSRPAAKSTPVPLVRSYPPPFIRLASRSKPSPDESQRISDLIASLAKIDSPDFGLSPTMSGSTFAPIPGTERTGMFVLGNHGLKRSEPLVELVKLGPRAIPLLLEALDDKTPTRLTMKLEGILSWMQFATEAGYNPAIQRERKAIEVLSRPERPIGESRRSHVVTVGDVCLVILGQITGRGYEAVRYQPTGGLVINSPTESPVLATAIREVWSSDDPDRRLLDSLLTDYSTRGVHHGDSFDHWAIGEGFQSPAAMRLLYYYPRETAPIITRRLGSLQVHSTDPPDHMRNRLSQIWVKRELANDVRTDEFLEAVSWCREPEIRKALHGVFRRAGDAAVLLAVLPSLEKTDWPLIKQRMEPVLMAQPKDEDGWYGAGYKMLLALHRYGGAEARPLFRRYLHRAGVQRSMTVCEVLAPTDGSWDREFLISMLSDRRASGTRFYPEKRNGESILIRVCDQAALVLSHHRKDLKFEMIGTHRELDQQIRVIKKRLGASVR